MLRESRDQGSRSPCALAPSACSPCAGDIADIEIDVLASDVVTFQLYRSELRCINGDPVACSFSKLRFIPAVGVSPLGGALDAAPLLAGAARGADRHRVAGVDAAAGGAERLRRLERAAPRVALTALSAVRRAPAA
jgi:hypothetical protein